MKNLVFCTTVALGAILSSNVFAQGRSSWGPATPISQPDFAHRSMLLVPQAVRLANGDAAAVWAQSRVPGTPQQFEQFSRQFTPATGWQPVVQDVGPMNGAVLGTIEANDSGQAALPYFQTIQNAAMLRQYDPVDGWSATPFQLNEILSKGANVQVAVDSAGNMLAIWSGFLQEGSLFHQQIYTRYFQNSVGWRPVEQIVEELHFGFGATDSPTLAMNSAGTAIVVWKSQVPGSNHNALYGRTSSRGGSWSDIFAVSDESRVVTSTSHPLTIDSRGAIHVLYDDAAEERLYFRSFDKLGGWTKEIVIDEDPETYAVSRHMVGNAGGDVLITWIPPTPSDELPSLYYRRFSPRSGLTPTRLLHTAGKGRVVRSEVTLSDLGEGLIVFSHFTPDNVVSIESLTYNAFRDTWLEQPPLFTQPLTGTVSVALVQLSLSANRTGAAVVVWGVKDLNTNTGRVWASLFR
jgi:hypothetical protein